MIFKEFRGETYFQISPHGIIDNCNNLTPCSTIELMFINKSSEKGNILIIGLKDNTYVKVKFVQSNLKIKQISQLCYLHLKKYKNDSNLV